MNLVIGKSLFLKAVFTVVLALSFNFMAVSVSYANDHQTADPILAKQSTTYEIYYNNRPYDGSIEGLSFDSDNCVITLNNAELSIYGTGLYVKGSSGDDFKITLEVIGNNYIVGSASGDVLLKTAGDVRIAGDGNLNITNARLVESKGNVGITCKKISVENTSGFYGAINTTKNVTVGNNSKISITTDGSEHNTAIDARKMKNSYKSLGKVQGRMPVGAEIYNKNGVYRVKKLGDTIHSDVATFGVGYKDNTVSLLKWIGGKNVKFTGIMTSKIMGFEYRTVLVKKNSFNTTAGKNVRAITINPNTVVKFEKMALSNTKSLTDIYISPEAWGFGDNIRPLLCDGAKIWKNTDKSRYGKFLTGAGKSNGKKVTVHVGASKKFYHPNHPGDHYDYVKAWYSIKGTGKFENNTKAIMKEFGMRHAPNVKVSSKLYMTKKEESVWIK